MLAHMGVFNYFPTYLTEVLGMSNTTAGTLTSLEALIGIPAGILGGRLADKWASPKKALALTLALMTVLIFCLPVFNAGNFIVALCIYGVVANSEAGLCMTSVSEVVPPEQANTAIAVVNTAQWTGAFLGPLLFATILSSTGWATCFHTMAAICVVAMVAILLAKRLR
jgi:MFS family permease